MTVRLTEKGVKKLEKIKDYWPRRGRTSSVTMRTKYVLSKAAENPLFHIEQRSVLRPDWNRCLKQGLIVDDTVEPVYVVEGTTRPLYKELG